MATDRLEVPTEMPHLRLREVAPDDASAFHDLIDRSRAALTQYGDYDALAHSSVDSLRTELASPAPSRIRFGIWLDHSLIGRFDLTRRDPGEFVLGFWLGSAFVGYGYATAAGRAAMDYARLKLGATDFYAVSRRGT